MPTQPTRRPALTPAPKRTARSASARAAAPPLDQPRRYELFSTDGTLKLRLQLTDEGVLPRPDGIDFMRDRRWTRRLYRDIAAVTLSTSALPDSSIIGTCRIEFGDGSMLLVTSADASGLSDGTRDGEFNAFVADFHRRLAAARGDRIVFRSGYGRARSISLVVSLLAAGAMFLALPIALWVWTGKLIWLGMLLFGVLLMLPGARLVRPNLGGTYRPEQPPRLLR
jgi:hypothetical protein